MNLSSLAFENNTPIPQKYGKDFENMNPPLSIADVPEGAKSLILFMEDPDVPESVGVPVFDHWIVFNIPPTVTNIPEKWTVEGTEGAGTRGDVGYMGPKPPDKEHRYFFTLLALNTVLDLPEGSKKEEIVKAIESHILDEVKLVGLYAPQR